MLIRTSQGVHVDILNLNPLIVRSYTCFLYFKIQIVVATTKGEVTEKEAGVMAMLLSKVEVDDMETVHEISAIAATLDPKTTEAEVEVMAEKATELSKEVKEEIVEQVADMVEEMGPVVSAREFKMIEKMTKNMDKELTKKDVKILSQVRPRSDSAS